MRSAALALGFLLLLPVAARSAPGDEPELIAQGIKLRDQNKDEAAFEVFAHAWERHRTARARAQLGLAAQALGRWALAEAHLAGALQMQDPWIDSKRSALEAALEVVRAKLGSLDVLTDVEGAEVMVDGQSVGRTPLSSPLRLPAGTVVVQVHAPGYVSVQRSTAISGGELSRESFKLVRVTRDEPPRPRPPDPAPAAALVATDRPSPPPAQPQTGRRRVLYSLIGATAVGAGLSLWSGLDTLSARDRYVARPSEMGYQDGIGRQRRTNLLFVSSGLLAAGALAWGLITGGGGP
jgi:hypothetical protein